jgi:hypothetical protein
MELESREQGTLITMMMMILWATKCLHTDTTLLIYVKFTSTR